MEHAALTRCIECGGATNALNEDEDGRPCAACAERLLETLPGVFHSPWGTAAQHREAEVEAEAAEPNGDGSD